MSVQLLVSLLMGSMLLTGCRGEPQPFRKQTSKVTGKLTVAGQQPGEPMLVKCHPISEEDTDPAHTTFSETMSNPDGTFEISTYQQGDGVPNGEYALTIEWGKLNLMTRTYGGPDKLKGAYSDPETSKFTFKVSGAPVDLGALDLTIPEGTPTKPGSETSEIDLGAGNDANKSPGQK